MGIVVGKNGSRTIESCDIGRVTKPGLSPMANNLENQDLPNHANNDLNNVIKAESERSSASENDSNIDRSPIISRDSYGALMKARFDRELKRFVEQKGK